MLSRSMGDQMIQGLRPLLLFPLLQLLICSVLADTANLEHHFPVRMYSAVQQTLFRNKDFAISPLGIKQALGILVPALGDDSALEIENLLKPRMQENKVKLKQNHLLYQFTTLGVQSGLTIDPEYISEVTQYGDAAVELTNFTSAQRSANVMNSGVYHATKNTVRSIVSDHTFEPDTQVLLVNGVFYGAIFANEFPTEEMCDFTVYPNPKKKVRCMRANSVPALFGDSVVALPLINTTSYLVLLQRWKGNLETLDLRQLLKALEVKLVNLIVPMFRHETTLDLKKPLTEVGVERIFKAGEAQLNKIGDQSGEYLKGLHHKTVFEIGRNGINMKRLAAKATPSHRKEDADATFTALTPFTYAVVDEDHVYIIGHYGLDQF
ncbi:serpin A12-like [Scaptodrosophila lebanonensis]|uniref:Serpin A12-like n=1 Tax=Drosophila lebanonensis TaxID=7225 RepID=A0A6J2UFU1_DROLE|nr:serpin A12-like [Scaptodrosophila lebanonensis]